MKRILGILLLITAQKEISSVPLYECIKIDHQPTSVNIHVKGAPLVMIFKNSSKIPLHFLHSKDANQPGKKRVVNTGEVFNSFRDTNNNDGYTITITCFHPENKGLFDIPLQVSVSPCSDPLTAQANIVEYALPQ